MSNFFNNEKALAAKKVISNLEEGSYVFGGYVRDNIAGDPFEDLDLFFPNNAAFGKFLTQMGQYGYGINFIRGGKYVKHAAHEVREITNSRGESIVKIDCIIGSQYGNPSVDGPVIRGGWDSNINAIAMDKNEVVFSLIDESASELRQTIKQIKTKTFTSLPGMTGFRKQKLLKKGFKEIMPSETAALKSEEIGFIQSFKQDIAPEVAYRVTANQLVKGTKQVALLGIAAKGGSSEVVKTISEVMNTEAGDVVVSGMLMLLCMHTPSFKDNPKIKKLAREFEISGMATGLNAVLDVARELLLPGLLDALKKLPDLPEETQSRVETTVPTQLFPEPSEEEAIVPQRMAAVR